MSFMMNLRMATANKLRMQLLSFLCWGLRWCPSSWTRGLHVSWRDAVAEDYGVSPPDFYGEVLHSRVSVPMFDGVKTEGMLSVLGDGKGGPAAGTRPTILVRTPYGSQNNRAVAALFVERGFNYLIMDTRGRGDSEGDFFPVQHEKEDGRAVVEWVKRQPFSDGRLGTHGVSYMGMTCWAAFDCAEIEVAVPALCSSSIFDIAYPSDGAVALELVAMWSYLLSLMATRPRFATMILLEAFFQRIIYAGHRFQKVVRAACEGMPLRDIDLRLVNHRIPYIQGGLENPRADMPYWDQRNRLAEISKPMAGKVHLIAGFHDIFCTQQIHDYLALQKHGTKVALTVGPWHHWQIGSFLQFVIRTIIQEYQMHFLEKETVRPDGSVLPSHSPDMPVEIYVTGAEEWRRMASWPPPARQYSLFLTNNGGLERQQPLNSSGHSSYVFDPGSPTPSVGGASFNPWNAGIKDQKVLEARSDVLSFTLPPLQEDLEVIGAPVAEFSFSTSLPSADLSVKLCEVSEGGKCVNVCEGYLRSSFPPNEVTRVWVELAPTAHLFAANRRLRVLVASAAFPRISRNTGSGGRAEAAGEETKLWTGTMRVHHSAEHPSFLSLPVCD